MVKINIKKYFYNYHILPQMAAIIYYKIIVNTHILYKDYYHTTYYLLDTKWYFVDDNITGRFYLVLQRILLSPNQANIDKNKIPFT